MPGFRIDVVETLLSAAILLVRLSLSHSCRNIAASIKLLMNESCNSAKGSFRKDQYLRSCVH